MALGRSYCAAEPDQSLALVIQGPPSNNQGSEPEYAFVEEPDQDCFCPVTMELLTDPYLTSCCGHHISQQAADRLTKERKPCPMCKEQDFTAQIDKFFKRKFINTLKVQCPHKKSGCEWTGELGNLNNHSTSCPKRPWECQYCGLQTTFEERTKHTPNCPQYPLPCPNECGIGTVPRYDAERHLLVCPLQLVECEFASIGCEVKVPRRDLARHMTENAQHHLMSATLLNLRLTRELHQKMEEKDQQIAELKQQLKEHEAKTTKQSKEVAVKLQQHTKELDTKLKQLQHQTSTHADWIVREFNSVLEFTIHKFTLTKFRKCQMSPGGSWYSDPFYNNPSGYRFKLNIDTKGHADASDTHLSAFLYLLEGDNDENLPWPVKLTVHLEMLNQRGDHDHHRCIGTTRFTETTESDEDIQYEMIGPSHKFFLLADLPYNAQKDTEYLKNDAIKFILKLKIL